MRKIIEKLSGGDLRSIGRADEVVKDILRSPALFKYAFEGIFNPDPVIRMRCADVLEKVSSIHPKYLQPYKKRLINEVSKIDQQEVKWHLAQMFSYLNLKSSERKKIIEILFSYLDNEKSNIVKVFSMQTLANFAQKDQNIKDRVIKKINKLIKTGSPAIVSRGKKLLNIIER